MNNKLHHVSWVWDGRSVLWTRHNQIDNTWPDKIFFNVTPTSRLRLIRTALEYGYAHRAHAHCIQDLIAIFLD